jgi:peptidoglycan/LPS O-acetylase OafA/YrhL
MKSELSAPASSLTYRPEIDGLRSLAVLPVILFHAGFTWFSGGFVGVDIFFVISGYLITSILAAEIAQGRFSIIKFYERRARRILPALFFVIIVTVPFALVWMPDADIRNLGRSIGC